MSGMAELLNQNMKKKQGGNRSDSNGQHKSKTNNSKTKIIIGCIVVLILIFIAWFYMKKQITDTFDISYLKGDPLGKRSGFMSGFTPGFTSGNPMYYY